MRDYYCTPSRPPTTMFIVCNPSGELVRRVRRARREQSVGALREAPPRLHRHLGGLQARNQERGQPLTR